jgi:penicillin-binding protein 1C
LNNRGGLCNNASPGSTLKPFIYALAFDQGLIHPLSVLGDAPTTFGSYTPDNFDKDFRGPMPARDALRLSRNVPAINLAAQLRSPDLYTFLRQAGISKLRPKQTYGLSLVLGGADVTMRELAELYAMLANDGIKQPLVLRTEDAVSTQRRPLLSAEASFLTLDALRDTVRPANSTGNNTVYWKTGTSNGFHDAWTAGIFGRYALVVWIGNFNGQNSPALVGVRSAAPLFFQVVDAVQAERPSQDLIAHKPKTLNLRTIDVCATTGDVGLDGCPVVTRTWFIPSVSPIKQHNVYRKILVNTRTGKQACRVQEGITAYKTLEVWPSDLQRTLEKAGIHKPSLPPKEPGCEDTANETEGSNPVIISPQQRVEYHARLDGQQSDAIPLKASADGSVKTLHWFIDNRYIGQSAPEEPLSWQPQSGQYTVRVVDDQGRAASTKMVVSVVQ